MTLTMVDLLFPVKGDVLPWDHSYDLFGALCRRQPILHQNPYPYGIFPINGLAQGNRIMKMTEKSVLRLRVPSEKVGDILPLVGADLELNGYKICLGGPRLEPVQHAARLYSPWVTYDGAPDQETFTLWLEQELSKHQVDASASLVQPLHTTSKDGGKGSRDAYLRRTRTVKGRQVVGYAVLVEGLSGESSAHLCSHGLGGRRHFGGGLFLPARNRP